MASVVECADGRWMAMCQIQDGTEYEQHWTKEDAILAAVAMELFWCGVKVETKDIAVYRIVLKDNMTHQHYRE